MKIELDGITVDGHTTLANGDRHRISAVEGWWGGPDVRGEFTSLIGEHGVSLALGKLSGREITLIGNTTPGPNRNAWQAMRYLQWGGLVGKLRTFRVFEPDGRILRAEVTRMPGSRFRQDIVPSYAYWELPLLAPDPRKYGDVLEQFTITLPEGDFNETGVLDQDGDFPMFPESIQVTGANSDAPITLSNDTIGQSIRLNGDVNGTGYLIYPRVAKVHRNGVEDYSLLNLRESIFWHLGYGPQTLRAQRANTSTGTMHFHVFYRDAYVD